MLTMTAGCSSDPKPTEKPGTTMEKPGNTPPAVADAGMPEKKNPCEGKKNPCETRTADAGAPSTPDAGRVIRGRGFILA